jgi:hypothetical protein
MELTRRRGVSPAAFEEGVRGLGNSMIKGAQLENGGYSMTAACACCDL